MKITVINNYDSFVYNLVRYLEEAGAEVNIQHNDAIDREELSSSDAILLSPGPGIPAEAGQLFEVIRTYHDQKPMLGVCLGHQAIGEVLGGSIAPCDFPVHGIASTIKVEPASLLFQGASYQLDVGRYHSWKVVTPPPNFSITATTMEGDIMAMEHTILPLYGVQFHPESILTPFGRTIMHNWLTTTR